MVKRMFLMLVALLALTTCCWAETVVELKSGRAYGGKIVARTETAITLKTGGEYMTFELKDVKRIYER